MHITIFVFRGSGFPASSNPFWLLGPRHPQQHLPGSSSRPQRGRCRTLTFRDGRGQCGLAVVHMADGAHVHMGLVAHIGLLGLHGQAAAQAGQCRGLQLPQQTLQQWGRGAAETCQGRSLGSGRGSEPGHSGRAPRTSPGGHLLPRPLTAQEGRRAQQGGDRHCARTRARVPGTGRPRVQKRKGTGDWRSLPAEVKAGRACLGPSSLQFLWPSLRLPGVGPKVTPGRCWCCAGGEGRRRFPQRSRASQTGATQVSLAAPGTDAERPVAHQRPGGSREL